MNKSYEVEVVSKILVEVTASNEHEAYDKVHDYLDFNRNNYKDDLIESCEVKQIHELEPVGSFRGRYE